MAEFAGMMSGQSPEPTPPTESVSEHTMIVRRGQACGAPCHYHVKYWRTGRKVGRTIYAQIGEHPSDSDVLIGTMDTKLLAEVAVAAHNTWVLKELLTDGQADG